MAKFSNGGIDQALGLIGSVRDDKETQKMVPALKEKKIRIRLVDTLGPNENGKYEWKKGDEIIHKIEKKDANGQTVIVTFRTRVGDEILINSKFRNCPIVIAGIIAHEFQHLINYEQKINGLRPHLELHSPEEEFTCQLRAGKVLGRIGANKVNYDPQYDGAFIEAHRRDWGDNWDRVMSDNFQKQKIEYAKIWDHFKNYCKANKEFLAAKGIHNWDELFDKTYGMKSKKNFDALWSHFMQWYKIMKERADAKNPYNNSYDYVDIGSVKENFRSFFSQFRGGATRCGRPCRDPKLSPCDIPSAFGPCHWHVGEAWINP